MLVFLALALGKKTAKVDHKAAREKREQMLAALAAKCKDKMSCMCGSGDEQKPASIRVNCHWKGYDCTCPEGYTTVAGDRRWGFCRAPYSAIDGFAEHQKWVDDGKVITPEMIKTCTDDEECKSKMDTKADEAVASNTKHKKEMQALITRWKTIIEKLEGGKKLSKKEKTWTNMRDSKEKQIATLERNLASFEPYVEKAVKRTDEEVRQSAVNGFMVSKIQKAAEPLYRAWKKLQHKATCTCKKYLPYVWCPLGKRELKKRRPRKLPLDEESCKCPTTPSPTADGM